MAAVDTGMRTCEACGASLEGRRRGARFCSSSCRTRAFKSRAKGPSTPEPQETLASVPPDSERPPSTSFGYSEEEIDAGLYAVAVTSGNTRRAAELLKQAGKRAIPRTTLRLWINDTHADRYLTIQETAMPEINRRMAENHEDLVQAYSEIQWQAIERVREQLPEMKGNEAANAFKSAAVAGGINEDKALLRRGQPTKIVEERDPIAILRLLEQKFPGLLEVNPALIEGKAEEIPDTETRRLGHGEP